MQLPPFHTAVEMREISNLAHRFEGALLAVVAIIAFVQAQGLATNGRRRFLWPALLLAAGVFLLGYLLFPTHGLDAALNQWKFILGTQQQVQHVLLALLLIVGGLAELRARRTPDVPSWWTAVLPTTIIISAMLFFLHPQHGSGAAMEHAMALHREIGVALFIAGMLRFAELVEKRQHHRIPGIALGFPLALLLSAVLLASYHEPIGAYEPAPPKHDGH